MMRLCLAYRRMAFLCSVLFLFSSVNLKKPLFFPYKKLRSKSRRELRTAPSSASATRASPPSTATPRAISSSASTSKSQKMFQAAKNSSLRKSENCTNLKKDSSARSKTRWDNAEDRDLMRIRTQGDDGFRPDERIRSRDQNPGIDVRIMAS